MSRIQHCFRVVYIPLLLAWIIEARKFETVDKDTKYLVHEAQDFSQSDGRLLLFGEIKMDKSSLRRKDCLLDISVEIGDKTWMHRMSSASFAFQIPLATFGGKIGMISIYEHEGKMRTLWSHFFIVQDVGVQRIDAVLSGVCTRITTPGTALISWIPMMCPLVNVIKINSSIILYAEPPTFSILICPVVSTDEGNICSIVGALEVYSTAFVEKQFSQSEFLKNLVFYIRDRIGFSDWHLIFGVRFLQTWHIHCLGFLVLFLNVVISSLRTHLLECTENEFSNLEPLDTADECAPIILQGEQQTGCQRNDVSFSGFAKQSNTHATQDLRRSTDILYQNNLWLDAHQYLRKLMDSPEDDSGFYYNCTTQRRSFNDILIQSGRWSRDCNGRLIRDHP